MILIINQHESHDKHEHQTKKEEKGRNWWVISFQLYNRIDCVG